MNYLSWSGEITSSSGKGCKDKELMKNKANKERRYIIDNSSLRDIVSAAIKMAYYRKFELIFLTATFAFNITEQDAQTAWLRFLKNYKLTNKFEKYVWTKERQKSGRIHYHMLCESGYVDIKKLQRTFNQIIKNIDCNFAISNNSLRLPDNRKWSSIVRNPVKVAKYIAKYVGKTNKEFWKSRCYAISNNLQPLKLLISDGDAVKLLQKYKYFTISDQKLYSKTILINVNIPVILRDFPVFIEKIT